MGTSSTHEGQASLPTNKRKSPSLSTFSFISLTLNEGNSWLPQYSLFSAGHFLNRDKIIKNIMTNLADLLRLYVSWGLPSSMRATSRNQDLPRKILWYGNPQAALKAFWSSALFSPPLPDPSPTPERIRSRIRFPSSVHLIELWMWKPWFPGKSGLGLRF